jgi:hypothetical protein
MIDITRRGLLRAGALLALGPRLSAPVQARAVTLVGATYHEQVYFDATGQTSGWHAPEGMRGLAATAHLDETAFRMAHPYG